MKVEGRCHCGEIAYEAIVDPASVSICHCSDCQMLSGSVYRVGVQAPADTFVLKKGRPNVYVKTADSGAKRAHSFCPDCGTPVHSAAVSDPQRYTLRVGCLRQRAELLPARQQWCDSGLRWAMDLSAIPQIRRQ